MALQFTYIFWIASDTSGQKSSTISFNFFKENSLSSIMGSSRSEITPAVIKYNVIREKYFKNKTTKNLPLHFQKIKMSAVNFTKLIHKSVILRKWQKNT